MSGGLLSGLDRAKERPYQGWKTNSSLSEEDKCVENDVCLLEDLSTKVNKEGSPNRTECLSNGDRIPGDFKGHYSSYKIPKKTNSSNVGVKRADEWFEASFEVQLPPPGRSKYSQASPISGKKRYGADRITQRNEIGYRLLRGGGLTSPSRRWKNADAPGWRQSEVSRSQQENILSCQVPDHRSNGTISTSDKSGNIQRNFKKGDKEESSKTLIEEHEHNHSMLDCLLRGNSVPSTKPNNDENGRTNSSDSDTNLETSIRANSFQDSTSPSKDISLSDNNHEDVFFDHCEKCLKRLTEDKKCRNCSNNVFPSQAATLRTHLSPNRFYASDKEKTKIRTYANQRRGNTPVLLARPDTEPSATPEISGGSGQGKSKLRKRKNQGKSATCSDSDLSPGRAKRGSKQVKLTLPKKDTVTELTVEESPLEATFSGPDDITSGPGALSDGDDDKDADVITDSINTKMTPKTRAKRKTPLSKVCSQFGIEIMPEEEVYEQADAVQNLQRQTLKITLLASEWQSLAGGLSTLNRELAINLSQIQNVSVSLLVPEGACSDEDKKEAGSFGISIIEARKCVGLDPLVWLSHPPENHKIDVIVGHGVKLGSPVQLIKRHAQFQNCKWVHVVHTAPENLSKYKDYDSPNLRGEEKHWNEIDLCKSADLVVPVGPRIAKAYHSYLQECKKDEDFFELIPGLFEREFGDLPAKQKPKEEEDDFIVLLCGRGDKEDFELKGYNIAVEAFASRQLKGKHYSLLFVGSPKGKQDKVRKRLLKYGITDEQLAVRKFVKSRERMKELFCEVDMVIMPSKEEGFGLVALEALSAGLPILIGSNSGFARTIKNIPLGKYRIVGDSGDPAKWAEAIEDVRDRHEVVLVESKTLKENYSKKYSWKKQCEELVDRLLKMVYGKNTRKKLSVEENKSSPIDASSSIATTNHEPSRSEQPKLTKQTGALGSTIVTQRKSPDVVNSKTEEPVANCVEPVKLDILRRHKEIEAHITLLDQHRKDQRENVQQHQRLLREVEEEKERLLERIRVLDDILNEKDQALTQ
ncbi:uncharacterized protein [Acropora muricata]|uniref:uncharacterized protein isoform X2 n=1 Tax=Acropora muricata TaxID=159855 RepID=UPI0034E57ED6